MGGILSVIGRLARHWTSAAAIIFESPADAAGAISSHSPIRPHSDHATSKTDDVRPQTASQRVSNQPRDDSAEQQQPAQPSNAREATAGSVQPSADLDQFDQRESAQPSARLSSCVDHLADVELQLVLQYLDKYDKLAAARCSRRLLAVADTKFAWLGAWSCVHFRDHESLQRIRTSLLRHAPVALTVALHRPSDLPVTLDAAAAVPLLGELHLIGDQMGPMADLLTSPALQRLPLLSLEAGRADLPQLLTLAAAFPQLRTLHLPNASGARLDPLLHMTALTELRIHLYPGGEAHQFDVIGRCTQLHSLSVSSPGFSDDQLAAFFCAPVMAQLRHLEVRHFSTGAVDVGVFAAAFSRMERLHSLRLDGVGGVDSLLSQLHHAPALRRLAQASPRLDPTDLYSRSTHPTVAVFAAMRAAAPHLQIRRCLSPDYSGLW